MIPITRVDSTPTPPPAPHEHAHGSGERRSFGQPAPCHLFVGDTPIDEAAIAREMQHHRATHPRQSRAAAARALVVRELLRLEAGRLHIAGDATPAGDETAEEARIGTLLEREITTPAPNREACLRYYEQNRARLHQPHRLRVRHILLAAAPDDHAARLAARELGQRLIEQLRADPKRFTELAQRHSACPSRDEGGDLGWIGHGDTTPEFERQLLPLPPGLAGSALETRYGCHVVCVDEIAHGQPLTFEQAEGKIAAYLETQAKQNAIRQYLEILSDRHGVRGLDEIEAAAHR
jgi:peptidyl-prolyl cis-trans isomerase C